MAVHPIPVERSRFGDKNAKKIQFRRWLDIQ
jgi:hypothetical protein